MIKGKERKSAAKQSKKQTKANKSKKQIESLCCKKNLESSGHERRSQMETDDESIEALQKISLSFGMSKTTWAIKNVPHIKLQEVIPFCIKGITFDQDSDPKLLGNFDSEDGIGPIYRTPIGLDDKKVSWLQLWIWIDTIMNLISSGHVIIKDFSPVSIKNCIFRIRLSN